MSKRIFTDGQAQDLYHIAKVLADSFPDFVIFEYDFDDPDLMATVKVPVTVKEMLDNIEANS